MPTRYIDAQTVSDEHGKGAEILRAWHSETYQFSSPSSTDTVINGPWKVEVDIQIREAVINVTDAPDANADIVLYVYRNQQRVALTASTAMDNSGIDTAANGPTTRVPWDWAITGQLSATACCSTPQLLFFLCPSTTTIVHFRSSTGLWAAACECGALATADFCFTDTSSGGVSISSICHTAGNNFGTLTMSAAVVSTLTSTGYDLCGLADTLAAACACAIFGPGAGCANNAAVVVQPISGDPVRNVFPFGPAVLLKEDMLYAETTRDTCSTESAAWSLDIGWMPALYLQTDYRSFP